MFTGIVEETGTVGSIRKGSGAFRLTIKCSRVLGNSAGAYDNDREGFDAFEAPTRIGDSIAVNGICLTVTDITDSSFTADVMPETLSRTSLSGAKPGTRVNLERAMPAYGRFGGHIVSGHIDGTGKITDIHKDGNAVWYTISAGDEIMSLIVEKGSVAIDGISLTVAKVSGGSFSVSIIPHTIEETILPDKKIGSPVNLETDIVGKYVKKLMTQDNAEEHDDTASDKRLLDLL
ncbi:MAG: riboflavin synthase [Eubacterium sp.]|nr:riboflavin synthase [Eubacterium sp.]